ncbi:MAG: glycosyltransferase family 2 protein [Candidatus Altiarchaeota archaeon]
MKTVAVIPVVNEENTILNIARETKNYVDEVIVVDDGSCDNTAENARKGGAIVLLNAENKGKGYSVRKGLEKALQDGAELVVTLDGDEEHDPKDVPRFLSELKNGSADLVVGTRFKKNKWARSKSREIMNNFTCFFMKAATGYRLSDTNCGFRAMTREYLSKVRLKEEGFEIDLEMILEARKHGLQVNEVVVSKPRNYAETGFSRDHMIAMNNFFDRWIIENHTCLNISGMNRIFLLVSSRIGLSVFQRALRLL